MTEQPETIPDEVLEQAAAWFYRLEASPQDRRLQQDFDAWMARSEAHARAWRLTHEAWRLTGSLSPRFSEVVARGAGEGGPREMVSREPRRRPAWPKRALAVTLALAASLMLFVAGPEIVLRLDADAVTTSRGAREIALDDGSVVHLAPGSAVAAKFTATGRSLSLLRGEAFLTIARDPARPFVVRADGMAVTVTGTAFNVAFTPRTYTVEVASGSVGVAAAGVEDVSLTSGQRLVVNRRTGRVTIRAIPTKQVAEWRYGRLVVENALLADVLDAIRRSHPGAILVTDTGLEDRRVTGVYEIDRPERALRALVGPFGGVVRAVTPYLLVVSEG